MMNTDAHTLDVADFAELVVLPHEPEADMVFLPPGSTMAEAMAEAEHRILGSALKACHGKVAEAARRLGIGRATFYRRMTAFQHPAQDQDLPGTGG
jgi:transcriptional regulator of acetoin/glycerol metabolism